MKKFGVFLLAMVFHYSCFSQGLISRSVQIDSAKKEIAADIRRFHSNLENTSLAQSEGVLIEVATNQYRKYLVAGTLYNIDPEKSFKLHEEIFIANQQSLEFLLEYALELHRRGKYSEAIPLYEQYKMARPDDIRAHVWLSDCYLNTGSIAKAVEFWTKSSPSQNHTSIDLAIYAVYGDTTQARKRERLRNDIQKGNLSACYSLLFGDLNWQFDWWNKDIHQEFLMADLNFVKTQLGEASNDFKVLKAYSDIKLDRQGGSEKLKKSLEDVGLILNNKPLPVSGEVASDLLHICFLTGLISETEFYQQRGKELYELAKRTKEKELLNVYAYLQATVEGNVSPEVDLLGWKEFKDERFAISYFTGRQESNHFEDPQLKKALTDFPNSAFLNWLKALCAKNANLPVKDFLVTMIKMEFKTLGTSPSRYCDRLNSYFKTLSRETL